LLEVFGEEVSALGGNHLVIGWEELGCGWGRGGLVVGVAVCLYWLSGGGGGGGGGSGGDDGWVGGYHI